MIALIPNLDRRPDRWRHVFRECEKYGIQAQRISALEESEARMILPDCPLTGGQLGLAATFLKIMDVAKSLDDEWVLYLEDDVQFNWRFSLRRLMKQLEKNSQSVALFRLGFFDESQWWHGRSLKSNLRRRLSPRLRYERYLKPETYKNRLFFGTQAIALRPSKIPIVEPLIWGIDENIDDFMHRMECDHPELFSRASRSMATQQNLGSDINAIKKRPFRA